MSAPTAPNVLVEKQNYKQLSWNKTFHAYYKRDWKAETGKYLVDKIIESNNKPLNWKWYRYESQQVNEVPSLRGNTLSDIGNDSMITIGDRRRTQNIDIYRINKQFDTFKKVDAIGASPCCRFSHSSDYIPMINSIFFFAGFDSKCNYNDARLLNLETLKWHKLQHKKYIQFRAHHATATRFIKEKNKFECYIFGGMYCSGGPYLFHNDLFKFTFYNASDDDEGYFECEPLVIKCHKQPEKRSQSYMWIHNDMLYVFGGTAATHTLNDLWTLNLNTNVWTEIEYKGILRAPETYTIQPRNYRVNAVRKPCYFDAEQEQLIVLHYGALSDVQKKYTKYKGSMKDFKQKAMNQEQDVKTKNMRLKGAIGLLQESLKCTIFVYDMKSKRWSIKRNMNMDDRYDAPSKLVGTRVLRIGEYLIQICGGARGSNVNYMKNLYMLKIPLSTWKEERLLWIAHYKDNDSIFNKCPKDIIIAIISFVREA